MSLQGVELWLCHLPFTIVTVWETQKVSEVHTGLWRTSLILQGTLKACSRWNADSVFTVSWAQVAKVFGITPILQILLLDLTMSWGGYQPWWQRQLRALQDIRQLSKLSTSMYVHSNQWASSLDVKNMGSHRSAVKMFVLMAEQWSDNWSKIRQGYGVYILLLHWIDKDFWLYLNVWCLMSVFLCSNKKAATNNK